MSEHDHDDDDGVGGPTPEQEAGVRRARRMERDQREALRRLRALLEGGAEGLVAAVDGISRRISDDGALRAPLRRT